MPHMLVKLEASPVIGGGHVFRCLSLASYFQTQGWDCSFLCTAETLKTVLALEQSAFDVIIADCVKPAPKDLGRLPHFDLIVFDQYDVDAAYERLWRDYTDKIMVIDDLADRAHECDILLDQNYFPDMSSRYQGLVPRHALQLLGPQYALLRASFSQARKSVATRKQVNRIFVCFGATDPQDMSSVAVEALKDFPGIVDIVIGSNSPNLGRLKKSCMLRDYLILHVDAPEGEMIKLMSRAGIAIGAGGTMSWERCCLGLPTIVVTIADNQREVAKHLNDYGAIQYLGHGNGVQSSDLGEGVRNFIANPEIVSSLSDKALILCDGNGTKYVYDKLLNQTDL